MPLFYAVFPAFSALLSASAPRTVVKIAETILIKEKSAFTTMF